MKTKLTVLLAVLAFSSAAHAGLYLRGGMLYNSPQDVSIKGIANDYRSGIDSALGFNVAVGGKLSVIRLEGEVNYLGTEIRNTDFTEIITSGDFRRTSMFANVLFEIPFVPLFEPYIGVGIGVSKIKVDFSNLVNLGSSSGEQTFSSSADSSRFSYQIMAGLRFSLFDMVSIYGGYRYFNADALSFTQGSYQLEAKGGAHMFELGLGIGF